MTELSSLFRLDADQKKALARLHITSAESLLRHFPFRYGEQAADMSVAGAAAGAHVTLYGTIAKAEAGKTFRGRTPIAKATLEDGTGTIALTWFSQPYIAKLYPAGTQVKVSGAVTERSGKRSLVNPAIEKVAELPQGGSDSLFADGQDSSLIPVYPETKGVSSLWFFHAIGRCLTQGIHEGIPDPIPDDVRKELKLPSLQTALVWMHRPKTKEDALAARKRFAFEEIFMIQVGKAKTRTEREEHGAFIVNADHRMVDGFITSLPYPLTDGQKKAIADILNDFAKPQPMSRLLEGDVGSGKTAVAAAAAYAITSTNPLGRKSGNLQVAYMAPTEILARQHFETFMNYFAGSGMAMALITGSGCKKFPSKVRPDEATDISRSQLAAWMKNGEIAMVVGTHALISKWVKFKDLGLVIIDEQHRFGTKQRQALREKEERLPHLLSMTATPIPRSLALTLYGDLDLSVLSELPKGRKPVTTKVVYPAGRNAVYEEVRERLKAGEQVYVICPRIDDPDPDKEQALIARSAVAEAKRLSEAVFPEYEIGVVHGKLSSKARDEVMERFAAGSVNILVATSVIEVGVNVPNATVIIIEGAERFGLAQLHQLRGRVMRSSKPPLCFLFPESSGETAVTRLEALRTAKNGFELAEADLVQRGAGALSGSKQWGITDLGMESLQNLRLVEAAREHARRIVHGDPTLGSYPALSQALAARGTDIHFE